MNELLEPEKPSFSQISQPYHRNEHFLRQIGKTESDIATIMKMIRNIAVRRADAERILAAFSKYTGKQYTLETVDVPVINEEEEKQP